MDCLPASSNDKQVIRILGNKQENQCTFDFTEDKKFIKRFFTDLYKEYYKQENEGINREGNTSKHRSQASKVFYDDKK
jgi:hypothetical protein